MSSGMGKRLRNSLLLLFLIVTIQGMVLAQEGMLVRITRLDTSDFPLVRVNLFTAGPLGAPLSDLSTLSLRENGIPIGDLEMGGVPIGVNVIFVIDANLSYLQVDDDSNLTRHEKVQESISRFAGQFMGELDRVTIIVPDEGGEKARFLIEDAVSAPELMSAVEGYNPEPLNGTPLNEMMKLALAHAADNERSGRFQTILLFTDGAQLHRQLNYADLVTQAQTIDAPIFAAILGARADSNEIENVARLYEPTLGTYVHLSGAIDTDPVYTTFRRQGTQTQIVYRSLQTKSGRYPVSINIGSARATSELSLAITPPDVTIDFENTLIRREGNDPDTPLLSLEPANYPVPITINWSDGTPRRLALVNLYVNGEVQLSLGSPLELDDQDTLTLDWAIAGLDEGTYTLVVQATDELGLSASSEPLSVTIEVERPLPPTPTAVPTEIPQTVAPVSEEPPETEIQNLALLGLVAVVATMLLLLRRRRGKLGDETDTDEQSGGDAPVSELQPEPSNTISQVVFLEMLEDAPGNVTRIRIEEDNVIIGRDHNVAQVVFADESVAQFHARIKKRDGFYWLYDEGSANGTFHNFQRLGLAPQPLRHRDTIHFGRLGFRFLITSEAEPDIDQI